MSAISYTRPPRFGVGWKRLAYASILVVLLVVSGWSVVRIVSGLEAVVSGGAPMSMEERIVRDAYEAVRQDPNNPTAHWRLSVALSTIGDHRRALDSAEAAVKIDAQMVEPFYALGLAYKGLGDLERAEKALAKAGSMPGTVGEVYREIFYDLGEVRLALNDAEGAVKAFESALANGPEATYVVVALADAYMEVGNTERAREEYLAALGYDPTNEMLAEKLRGLGVSDADIESARDPIAHRPIEETE